MDAIFFDTDMYIHRLSPDKPVRESAEKAFHKNKPSAMSEFSIVEFKGNYIACLVLLRRKISDSDSLQSAYSRIQNSGGRKATLMLAQLFRWLGGIDFPVNPWPKAKNILLTYLDSQIEIVWQSFINSVDKIERQFECNRAREEPQDNNGKWSARIPRCKADNTKCTIGAFLLKFFYELGNLISGLDALPPEKKTTELEMVDKVAKEIIQRNRFRWQNSNCRKIGDLLIGLESKSGKALISSNYKEHSILSQYLGYTFNHFDVTAIRLK